MKKESTDQSKTDTKKYMKFQIEKITESHTNLLISERLQKRRR